MLNKIHPLMDFGGELFYEAAAVATYSYTPPNDRAALIVNVNISAPSATDVWRLKCQGKDILVDRVLADGLNHLTGLADSGLTGSPYNPTNIFGWLEMMGYEDGIIPVANGEIFKVVSDGGATANIQLTILEVPILHVNNNMMNRPNGSRFLSIMTLYIAAAVAAAGDIAFDTFVAQDWLPDVWTGGAQRLTPRGAFIEPLAMFIDAGGVNTRSGGADHQSITNYLRLNRGGTQLFTRTAGGVIARGAASLAGSANRVFGTVNGKYRGFDVITSKHQNMLHHFKPIRSGETIKAYLGISGDVTGGADYSHHQVKIVAIVHDPATVQEL